MGSCTNARFDRRSTPESHTDEISHAVFHPTLPELAAAGADGTLKFWHGETGTRRLSIPARTTLQASTTARMAAPGRPRLRRIRHDLHARPGSCQRSRSDLKPDS